MNWTRKELQSIAEDIVKLPAVTAELDHDGWLLAYRTARLFAEYCAEADRRERELVNIMRQNTPNPWKEAVAKVADHPPLDWLAVGLQELTEEQVKIWNDWCRKLVFPICERAPGLMGLHKRLDRIRESLSKSAQDAPALLQNSRQTELRMFRTCDDKGDHASAAKHLETAISSMMRLSLLDGSREERNLARSQATAMSEEGMPGTVAKHFQSP